MSNADRSPSPSVHNPKPEDLTRPKAPPKAPPRSPLASQLLLSSEDARRLLVAIEWCEGEGQAMVLSEEESQLSVLRGTEEHKAKLRTINERHDDLRRRLEIFARVGPSAPADFDPRDLPAGKVIELLRGLDDAKKTIVNSYREPDGVVRDVAAKLEIESIELLQSIVRSIMRFPERWELEGEGGGA